MVARLPMSLGDRGRSATNGRTATNGRNATKSHMRAKGPVPTTGSVHHPSQGRSRLLWGASAGTGEPGACYSISITLWMCT